MIFERKITGKDLNSVWYILIQERTSYYHARYLMSTP
jgi:hypothetical protein